MKAESLAFASSPFCFMNIDRNASQGIGLLIFAVTGLALYSIFQRVKRASPTANPWDAETDKHLQEADALPICHHCLTPQEPRHNHWFCPNCGAAVGEYNNYLPFVRVFSEGEVLRTGTAGLMKSNFLIVAGYFLCSLILYTAAAPVYWYFLLKNLKRNTLNPQVEKEVEIPPNQT